MDSLNRRKKRFTHSDKQMIDPTDDNEKDTKQTLYMIGTYKQMIIKKTQNRRKICFLSLVGVTV